MCKLQKIVRGVAHCRYDDYDVIAAHLGADDTSGHVHDAAGICNGGSSIFLYD